MTLHKEKRPSLAFQLMKGLFVPFLIMAGLIGMIAFFSAQDEISEVYDSQLISSAQQLWHLSRNSETLAHLQIGEKDPHLSLEDQAALEDYAKWRSFSVWRKGVLLLTSETAPSNLIERRSGGFSDLKNGKDAWRIFTFIVPEDGITVEVGEKLAARQVISERIVWGVSLPLLLALPIILFVMWLGIRWGLKDLRSFAAAIESRSANDLSRVGSAAIPIEIAPVAEAVDQLLSKLERSLAQERLFTDNAAHELRTPLAALGLQADVIRNARSARERDAMLSELTKGVARVSRLLDQLLTLARVSHTPVDYRQVELLSACREALKEAYAKAHSKDVVLSLSGDEGGLVLANQAHLAILLGNLIDNAIKYAPKGSLVEVYVRHESQKVVVYIRDRGPGIPESERSKVFTRFYRVKGSGEPGSGLGLSIAQSLGELLNAELQLLSPSEESGLLVRLAFPSV